MSSKYSSLITAKMTNQTIYVSGSENVLPQTRLSFPGRITILYKVYHNLLLFSHQGCMWQSIFPLKGMRVKSYGTTGRVKFAGQHRVGQGKKAQKSI